jgi:hypothetical protein
MTCKKFGPNWGVGRAEERRCLETAKPGEKDVALQVAN